MARATRLPAEVTVGLPVVPVTSTPREEGTGPSRCAASKPSAEEWQTLVDLKNKLAALETRLVDWSQRLEAREAALDDSPAHAEQASRLREHEQKMQRETAALRRREAACTEREAHVIALQQQREEEYDAWVADVEAQRAKWSAMHAQVQARQASVDSQARTWQTRAAEQACVADELNWRSAELDRVARDMALQHQQWSDLYSLYPAASSAALSVTGPLSAAAPIFDEREPDMDIDASDRAARPAVSFPDAAAASPVKPVHDPVESQTSPPIVAPGTPVSASVHAALSSALPLTMAHRRFTPTRSAEWRSPPTSHRSHTLSHSHTHMPLSPIGAPAHSGPECDSCAICLALADLTVPRNLFTPHRKRLARSSVHVDVASPLSSSSSSPLTSPLATHQPLPSAASHHVLPLAVMHAPPPTPLVPYTVSHVNTSTSSESIVGLPPWSPLALASASDALSTMASAVAAAKQAVSGGSHADSACTATPPRSTRSSCARQSHESTPTSSSNRRLELELSPHTQATRTAAAMVAMDLSPPRR